MRNRLLSFFFLLAFSCLAAPAAHAQDTWQMSTVWWDPSTNTIWGYSATELDYYCSYDYSASVEGQLQDQNANVLDWNFDEEPNLAEVYTTASASSGSGYAEVGYHGVVQRYYEEVIDKSPDGCYPCDGCNNDCYWYYNNWFWWDPYGFSFMNPGTYNDFWEVYGPGPATQVEDEEYIPLDDTVAIVVTPDDSVTFINVAVDDGTPVSFADANLEGVRYAASVNVGCGGERFKVVVRFSLPQHSSSCCAVQNSRVNVFSNSKFELVQHPVYGYKYSFFPDTSPPSAPDTTPPLVVAFVRRKGDGSGTSNTLRVLVGGSYGSFDTYSSPANVHLICQ